MCTHMRLIIIFLNTLVITFDKWNRSFVGARSSYHARCTPQQSCYLDVVLTYHSRIFSFFSFFFFFNKFDMIKVERHFHISIISICQFLSYRYIINELFINYYFLQLFIIIYFNFLSNMLCISNIYNCRLIRRVFCAILAF